jgi:hypothetical protein
MTEGSGAGTVHPILPGSILAGLDETNSKPVVITSHIASLQRTRIDINSPGGAAEKLFIEASASSADSQRTMASQVLSLPGADSGDKKPEHFEIYLA